MADFTTSLKAFKRLNAANDSALDTLAKMQASAQGDTSTAFTALLNDLAVMEEAFRRLVLEGPEDLGYFGNGGKLGYVARLDNRFEEVMEDARHRAKPLVPDGTPISPKVAVRLQTLTMGRLATLDERLEGCFAPDDITLAELSTPHDFIRYMHQVGTESFFDPNHMRWHSSSGAECFSVAKNEGGMQLHAISTDGGDIAKHLANDPLLARFSDIARTGRFITKKKDYAPDNFYALVDAQNLAMQMPLGCHYGTLKARKLDRGYDFSFRFVNTSSYSASKFRSNITKSILTALGYEVMQSGEHNHIFSVHRTFDSDEEAAYSFEQILRFAVGTLDVDCLDANKVKARVDDTTDAFMAGVINLYDYLTTYKKGSHLTYLQEKGMLSPEQEKAWQKQQGKKKGKQTLEGAVVGSAWQDMLKVKFKTINYSAFTFPIDTMELQEEPSKYWWNNAVELGLTYGYLKINNVNLETVVFNTDNVKVKFPNGKSIKLSNILKREYEAFCGHERSFASKFYNPLTQNVEMIEQSSAEASSEKIFIDPASLWLKPPAEIADAKIGVSNTSCVCEQCRFYSLSELGVSGPPSKYWWNLALAKAEKIEKGNGYLPTSDDISNPPTLNYLLKCVGFLDMKFSNFSFHDNGMTMGRILEAEHEAFSGEALPDQYYNPLTEKAEMVPTVAGLLQKNGFSLPTEIIVKDDSGEVIGTIPSEIIYTIEGAPSHFYTNLLRKIKGMIDLPCGSNIILRTEEVCYGYNLDEVVNEERAYFSDGKCEFMAYDVNQAGIFSVLEANPSTGHFPAELVLPVAYAFNDDKEITYHRIDYSKLQGTPSTFYHALQRYIVERHGSVGDAKAIFPAPASEQKSYDPYELFFPMSDLVDEEDFHVRYNEREINIPLAEGLDITESIFDTYGWPLPKYLSEEGIQQVQQLPAGTRFNLATQEGIARIILTAKTPIFPEECREMFYDFFGNEGTLVEFNHVPEIKRQSPVGIIETLSNGMNYLIYPTNKKIKIAGNDSDHIPYIPDVLYYPIKPLFVTPWEDNDWENKHYASLSESSPIDLVLCFFNKGLIKPKGE